MITVRRSSDRGRAQFGWLDSHHSFSFGHYFDPNHMGFGPLRVINEDRVTPSAGFPTHGHQNMEIISYVISGALEHKDSEGNQSVIRPGDVQRMSAGTGIHHSEYNGSDSEPVHFLQIWVVPDKTGLKPGYEQINFPHADGRNSLTLVGSPDGREGSVTIHQDVYLYRGLIDAGERVSHTTAKGRGLWLQVVAGKVDALGQTLSAGDGAAVTDVTEAEILAHDDAEVLLFDLPR